MFDRVLVPLDGSDVSEQILPYAADLARASGAGLDLLRVCDTSDPALAGRSDGHMLTKLVGALRSEAESYLQTVIATVDFAGLRVGAGVEEGSISSTIADVAGRHPNTVVAIATHGKVGLGRMFSGSVADDVLRTTSVPVLLVGPKHAGRGAEGFGAAVVPLDGSELGEKVLPLASSISRALGTDLVLVRVLPRGKYLLDRLAMGTGQASNDDEDVALDYLHAIRDDLRREGARSTRQRIVYGRPADGILQVAGEMEAEHPGTFIIMTTHARSGAARLALGSVTDSVIHSAERPVLVIHPSD